MFKRCKHQFKETQVVYTPAVTRAFEVERVLPGQLDKILFGFTTIKLVCSECGMIDFVEATGNQITK